MYGGRWPWAVRWLKLAQLRNTPERPGPTPITIHYGKAHVVLVDLHTSGTAKMDASWVVAWKLVVL